MQKQILYYPERCMLCQSCILACQMNSLGISEVTGIPRDAKPLQRLVVTFFHGTPWVWKCQQCLSAPCVESCVSGSLRHGEGGSGVIHDRETCVGCGSCMMACPFNAMLFDQDEDRVAKCDLCPGETVPPCVQACGSGALVCQGLSPFTGDKRKKFVMNQRVHRGAD